MIPSARMPSGRPEPARRSSFLSQVSFPAFANLASSASAAEAWAVGFNWYLNKNLRLLFDYEVTSFEGGAAAGDREDEKILFSRFQVAF